MKIKKIILFPLSLIYGIVVLIRNLLYDYDILKKHTFDIPVICVGNLTTGGTGKTPHIEYLVKILHRKGYKPAVLSRGYKRSRPGYIEVSRAHTATEVGDEPCQIKQKFPGVIVAVHKNRVEGIKRLTENHQNLDVILLDDGYQHRSVKAGLNILLTDYTDMFTGQLLLPAGNLREPASEKKRADIIVISKGPQVFSPIEYRRVSDLIKPLPHQLLYFSSLVYNNPIRFDPESDDPEVKPLSEKLKVLLFSGIANPIPLKNQIMHNCRELHFIGFGDHHKYTESDFRKIEKFADKIHHSNRMILTTEKDVSRIRGSKLEEKFKSLPLFYIPVKTKLHPTPRQETFEKQVYKYVAENNFRSRELPAKENQSTA